MFKYLCRIISKLFKNRLFTNVNRTAFDKQCLLIYVIEPFICGSLDLAHQNQWQTREIARILGEVGFNVDVIRFDNKVVSFNKRYDLVVDLHPGIHVDYSSNLNPNAIKIFYGTGSNPSFTNRAEAERLENLFTRRGVRLTQRRSVKPLSIDDMRAFDVMLFIGNAHNQRTYDEFNLSMILPVTNNGFPFTEVADDSQKSPRNFLFLASGGQVHKGLDLLLEVFARNPELHLFICSSFKAEKDFCTVYEKELYRTPNIHPIGFININSAVFMDVYSLCSFMVLPSCAEANAGSVLTAMSVGLIPLVSRECGFEDDEVHYFTDCSITCIEKTVNDFADRPHEWVKNESVRVRSIVTQRYSPRHFTESVQTALRHILALQNSESVTYVE